MFVFLDEIEVVIQYWDGPNARVKAMVNETLLIEHYCEYWVDSGYSNEFLNKMQSLVNRLLVVARTQCGVRMRPCTEACRVLASPLLPWQQPWKI